MKYDAAKAQSDLLKILSKTFKGQDKEQCLSKMNEFQGALDKLEDSKDANLAISKTIAFALYLNNYINQSPIFQSEEDRFFQGVQGGKILEIRDKLSDALGLGINCGHIWVMMHNASLPKKEREIYGFALANEQTLRIARLYAKAAKSLGLKLENPRKECKGMIIDFDWIIAKINKMI